MTQKHPQPLSRSIPPPGVSLVIDPYGEFAAEAAPRIEDTLSGKITVISMGANQLKAVPGEMELSDMLLNSREISVEG